MPDAPSFPSDPGATMVDGRRPGLSREHILIGAIVFLLGGGSATAITGGIGGGDSGAALVAAEMRLTTRLDDAERDAIEATERLDAIEDKRAAEAMERREHLRREQWMVGMLLQQHQALAQIGEELGVKLELTMTPYVPGRD